MLDLGRKSKGRCPQQSDDELDWEDLSDDPESSDEDSEQEVFVSPRKCKHNKRAADSSDGDAYTRVRKKVPLVMKAKKSKKSKKRKSSSSDSSSDSSTTT